MSSMQDKPDLTPLQDTYDVVGELGATDHVRSYVGTRRQDGRDVLITIMRGAGDVAHGKAIAQFAADANLLTTLSHPRVPQVLEGRWIGDDAFALVSDRVQGTTLAEMLKGERLPNPRIADILADVDGVLDWARGERLAHRGVTPEGIQVERGTGKVWVSLSPTESPKTNRPDARDDARTIGGLAMTMLTAKPMADDHDGTLVNMRPDLPQRVVDATEKVAAMTMNDEQPNISAYLASIAMADAIKEGEVEVARIDAEFRAAMKAEREKWQAEQDATELANLEMAKKFAEERAEYERRAAKEREQLAAVRGEIDGRRAEVQEARTELEQARVEFKQKKSELEARVKEIDRHAKDLEKQKRDTEKHSRELEKRARDLEKRKLELEARNRDLEAAAALVAASSAAGATSSDVSMDALKDRLLRVDQFNRTPQPVDALPEEPDVELDTSDEFIAREMAGGIESVEDVHAPWTPIEEAAPWTVPLDTDEPVKAITYEAAALPEPEATGRPRWMIPAGIAALILLVGGAAWGISHRASSPVAPVAVATAPRAGVPSDPTPTASRPVSDSAAGVIVPSGFADSAEFTAIRDSIATADAEKRAARRAQQAADDAAAARARALRASQTVTDSNGTKWTTVPPPSLDSARRAKKDTVKVKPDTVVKADTRTVRGH